MKNSILKMDRIFISPPFGNYIPGSKSIKGSFTVQERLDSFWRNLLLTRYDFKHRGWLNRMGLQNIGIDRALKKHDHGEILSIAFLDDQDVHVMLSKIPKNQNLELNLSCPNCDIKTFPPLIERFLNQEREWCIVKLGAEDDHGKIDALYELGFRQFHFSNTKKTSRGALSGPCLKKHTVAKLNHCKRYQDMVKIAGGGIQGFQDIALYKHHGADFFSVSTVFLNPFMLFKLYLEILIFSKLEFKISK